MILRFLLERVFTEDRAYPEKEVNQRLALFHPDVAALRRYLYDERYVDRDHGLYTRRTPRPALPVGQPLAASRGRSSRTTSSAARTRRRPSAR